MKNLLEQLNRMKDLMVYENGATIDEVSTSRSNNPTPETNPDNTKEKESKGSEETKSSENKQETQKQSDCMLIKASGEFVVNVDKNSGAVKNFIKNLENLIKNNSEFNQAKVKGGSMYITEITLQGFASNYYGGAVEPDFDNDWCKKWEKRGKLYDGLCSEWEMKPFSGKKLSSYKGKKTTNNDLASRRAVNLYNALKEELSAKAEKEGIKISPDLKPKYLQGGTIYTEDKVDENWKTRISQGKINPGQIVLCTATVCYELPKECTDPCMEKDEEGNCKCKAGLKEVDGKCVCEKTNEPPNENCECEEEKGCPDRCMEKDEEGNCKCKPGLKEIDDPENEGQKKCVCEDGSEPDDDCKCEKKKECPDPCMKRNEEGNCECPPDMEYDEEKKECVCKDKNKVKVPGGCKCEKPKNPLKCNESYEKKGVRGTKENNYVGASLITSFPVGVGNSITIDFDSVVVPDAFYVKYGDQEYWSGFMGSVYDTKYRQIALSLEDRKLMLPIQSKGVKDMIKRSLSKGDNDYSQMVNVVRNFVGELIMYKRNKDLIGSINSAISNVKGKMKVNSLFDGGDSNAEKVTDDIISSGSLKDNINKYEGIMKRNVSFTIDKEQENYELVVLVFSPLDRTIFKMKVNCQ
jgi:hypothetical protein